MLNKLKRASALVKISLVLAATIIFVFGFFQVFAYPYHGAEKKLRNEVNSLHISDTLPVKQTYKPGDGICLNQCPELVTTYTISPVSFSDEQKDLANYLYQRGYLIGENIDNTRVTRAEKGNFQLDAYLNISDTPPSTTNEAKTYKQLVINLTYRNASKPAKQLYCNGKPVKTYRGTDCKGDYYGPPMSN
jgi:hypothetical protein